MKRQRKIHYAWVVFLSCIFLKLGVGGVVYSIAGNFVTPVVNALGCTVSRFTMVVSIEAAAMALMYTTASKIMNKGRIGWVMGLASLAQVIGVALMGCYRTVEMFYISGAVIGIGVAFTGYVAIPMVVNMWFKKKTGTVLGIIIASENVATILYSLLTAELIVRCGWRMTYLIIAVMALVLSVPAVFLFIKSPEEAGCRPYGEEEGTARVSAAVTEWGLTKKEAVRNPVFYMAWFTCMLYSLGCGVQQYVATFATMELGQTIAFGAWAAMCVSLGCIVSSMVLGFINDRFGARAGLGYGGLCILAGYGCMLLSIRTPWLCIPAALIVGLGGSMYTVQCPLIARTALGSRDYSSIWSLMMVGNSMIGALGFSSIGLFYDIGGSYRGAFLMAICLYTAAFVIGSAAIHMGKRLTLKKEKTLRRVEYKGGERSNEEERTFERAAHPGDCGDWTYADNGDWRRGTSGSGGREGH